MLIPINSYFGQRIKYNDVNKIFSQDQDHKRQDLDQDPSRTTLVAAGDGDAKHPRQIIFH